MAASRPRCRRCEAAPTGSPRRDQGLRPSPRRRHCPDPRCSRGRLRRHRNQSALRDADHLPRRSGVVKPTPGDVFGVLSLIFWSITIIVSLKYMTFIMRADNDGEGGIMALIAKVQTIELNGRYHEARAGRARDLRCLALLRRRDDHARDLGPLGGRGGRDRRPRRSILVVPITLAIIIVLFSIQRFGTGRRRPPLRAGDGLLVRDPRGHRRSSRSPATRRSSRRSRRVTRSSSSPATSASRSSRSGRSSSSVTGAEALYADMGHFGRSPIRRAWFFLVFPALTLNYLGQGSLILDDRPRSRTRSSS